MKTIDPVLLKRKRSAYSRAERSLKRLKLDFINMQEVSGDIATKHLSEGDEQAAELAAEMQTKIHRHVGQELISLINLMNDFAAIPEHSHMQ